MALSTTRAHPLASLRLAIRQFKALMSIYIQDGFAYRASGFIWVLTDAVTAVTMPLVLIAAAKNQGGSIQGFTPDGFVIYYLCMLMVGSFVTSHFMWEIGSEIRDGVFSTHIIRPVSYYQFMMARNAAWRVVRTTLFLPLFVAFLLAYSAYLHNPSIYLGWEFWVSLLLGHIVSFSFVVAMAMIALFTQEALSIFELYYIPMLFLSGQLFPVALFPPWAKNIAMFTPFYYTTGAPTEIIIGRLHGPAAWGAIGMQLVWIGISFVAFKVLWKLGLKQYTGVGM